MATEAPCNGADGCLGCTASQFTAFNQTLGFDQTYLICSGQYDLADVIGRLTTAEGSIQGVQEGLNTTYLVLSAALVFIMHGGFAMVRSLHHRNHRADPIRKEPQLLTPVDVFSSAALRRCYQVSSSERHQEPALTLSLARESNIENNRPFIPQVQKYHEHSSADYSGCSCVRHRLLSVRVNRAGRVIFHTIFHSLLFLSAGMLLLMAVMLRYPTPLSLNRLMVRNHPSIHGMTNMTTCARAPIFLSIIAHLNFDECPS